jgi:hypothetical protein
MRFLPLLHIRWWLHAFKSVGRIPTLASLTAIAAMTLSSQTARAEFSQERPISHFYNAHLLEQGELQISTISKVSFGLFDTVEVGTNALMTLVGFPNLFLKHQMFFVPRAFQTSFVSHLFYNTSSTDTSDVSGEESSDESEESSQVALPRNFGMYSLLKRYAGSESSSSSLIGQFGIVTSVDLNETNSLNFGLYDFINGGTQSDYNVKMFLHYICPMVSFDRYLGKHWAMSVVASPAIYALGTLSSDAGDMSLRLDLMDSKNSAAGFHMGFATFTYSAAVLNIEFGLAAIKLTDEFNQVLPYVNLFWRII